MSCRAALLGTPSRSRPSAMHLQWSAIGSGPRPLYRPPRITTRSPKFLVIYWSGSPKSPASQPDWPNSSLELGTKPSDLVEADEGAGERGEGEVEVDTALVADGQAAEACQPGQGT